MLTKSRDGVQTTLSENGRKSIRGLPHGGQAGVVPQRARIDATNHALAKWPEEACGVFVQGGQNPEIVFEPLDNIHENRIEFFCMDLGPVLMSGDTLHGVFHSHPNGVLEPSWYDMETQLSQAVPFYICVISTRGTYMDFFGWGDQLPIQELKGRQFRTGVHDCYSLYRDWNFLEYGRIIPDFPRDRDGWEGKSSSPTPLENMRNYEGWVPVDLSEIKRGDGLMFNLRHRRVTHCGVYLGGGLFMHHLHGKISKTEPLQPWLRFYHQAMRYRENE